ncbi:hypothetical protein K9B35_02360 [Sphingomonas sp. R647]|nr:hypothetical protein [Sphingomonas sp. R647]
MSCCWVAVSVLARRCGVRKAVTIVTATAIAGARDCTRSLRWTTRFRR